MKTILSPLILLCFSAALFAQSSVTSPFASRIKRGTGEPSAGDCATSGDVGRVYVRTDQNNTDTPLRNCSQTGTGPDTFGWVSGGGGATGPTGATGATGSAGAAGATGPQGDAGVAGATGPAGPTGPSGTNGTNGADGATGPAGPTGATGATGSGGLPETGGTGIVVQTGVGTTAARSVLIDSNELALTNPDGVAGNLLLAFATNIDISSRTLRIPGSNTLPATCTLGRIYFDRDATPGRNLYGCTDTSNTWTLLGDGGGSATFDTIGTGTNTTATMTIGAGGTLTYTSTGVNNANQFKGNATIADADVASTLARDSEVAAAYQPLDADLTTLAGKTLVGTGANLRFSTGSPATDDCAKFDSNGNIVSAGAACGSGGSGATAVTGLTDNKVTVSGAIYTVAAGVWHCLDSSGVMQAYSLSEGYVERTTGTTAGTLRFGVNCNNGSPIYVARIETAITLANYDCTGVTCTSSNTFADGDWALATGLAGASLGTPSEYRGLGAPALYKAGNGLSKTGDTFSANCAYVGCLGTAASWTAKQTFGPGGTNAGMNVGSVAGDPSSPANGDMWYDSTANELTARINGATVALGAGGGGATIRSGNYADLGSCTAGDLYTFEDSPMYQFARCTTTDTYGKIYADGKTVTVPPSAASFTEVTTGASGTSSENNTGGTLNILIGSDGAVAVSNAYTKALLSSSTFTITVGFRAMVWGAYSAVHFGISTGTGATADQQALSFTNYTASGATYSPAVINFADWAFSALLNGAYNAGIQSGIVYARIRQASGSRHYEISSDRINWAVVETVTDADHISSPTHFYIRVNGQGTATIFHLLEE